MAIEKRQFTRYVPAEGAFAALRPYSDQLGRLKDISTSGLAFEYISQKEGIGESSTIDIFLTDDGFFLGEVPCSVVYDKLVSESVIFPSAFYLRRCGVKFTDLTEDKEVKLSSFLRKHIKGTARRSKQNIT